MLTTIGIDVAAPADLVFAVAHDPTRWERILPHYARSRPVARHADGSVTCLFVARRPLIPFLGLGIPVAWRSRTWNDPTTRRLRFLHMGGVTDGMDVRWRIEPAADGGTRIEIAHAFERGPGGGRALPAVVDRLFTRPIASRTLATVKAIAESLATLPGPAGTEDPVPETVR
jgi:hypothetical protein